MTNPKNGPRLVTTVRIRPELVEMAAEKGIKLSHILENTLLQILEINECPMCKRKFAKK